MVKLNAVRQMPEDIVPFAIGVALLIFYLLFSAMTEMGTKLPWKK